MGRQQDEEHDWGFASACIQHDEYHFHGTDDVLQALGEHCPRKNLEIPREQLLARASSLNPCISHPSGVFSLLKYPSIICGTEDQSLLVHNASECI